MIEIDYDDGYEPHDDHSGDEPDCFGCMDRRVRPRRWLPGMTGCPDCNPTWWQHQRWLWHHRWRVLVPRRRPPASVDEAPF